MTTAAAHEALTLYPVYYCLVEHWRPGHDVRETDPADLVGAIAIHGRVASACLIMAHCGHLVTRLKQAGDLVDEVYDMALQGDRPRYLAEMGLGVQDALGGQS